MKEYLKMSDVFKFGDVEPRDSTMGGTVVYHANMAWYAAHAINSHDGLVAEVELLASECNQLTEQLFEADKMVQEMQQIIDGGAA